MTITALPTPPSRSDSANFATRGDAFLAALPTFATEANALQVDVNAKYNELASSYQSAANIAIAANTATSQAAAAVVAKDAAVAAWAASTSPAETLASISKSLHYGAVVKAIIYDTSKDSDGGGWRKRCADKSWYTESLGFTGTWGGQAASNAAGWAACGSVVGGAYQSTADGKFYTPTSSSTQTEIFRGNVREFPEQVAIVAESGRVVIYDLTQAGTPMWASFVRSGVGIRNVFNWYTTNATSLAAGNGRIFVGSTDALATANFIADRYEYNRTNANYPATSIARISPSNVDTAVRANGGANIVSNTVNDVALTVLDNAPIDAATSLPTPTIAVATAGGISVIKDDGTVVNSSQTDATGSVAFSGSTLYISNRSGGAAHARFTSVIGLGASWTPTTLYNYLASGGTYDESKVVSYGKGVSTGGNSMLALYKHNPASSNSSLRAQITIAYNSGWLPGDIRGAHLADTVAETITGSGELVSNGDFPTNTTGWTAVSSTLSVVSGAMRVTNSTNSVAGYAYQAITCVVGKTYKAIATLGTETITGAMYLYVGTSAGGGQTAAFNLASTNSVDFVATQTTHYVAVAATTSAQATEYFDVDNISVKLAEPDRSVKNKGLTLVGSLTKAAVASGAALVAYSGFSSSNYLEQPYNSDLDFGTGDFSIILWHKQSAIGTLEYLFNRDSPTPGKAIRLWVNASGYLVFELYDGTTTRTATGAVSVGTTVFNHIVCTYTAGTLTIYLNGVSYATVTGAALLTMTNATAIARIGYSVAGASPATNASIALLRLSATIPSVV